MRRIAKLAVVAVACLGLAGAATADAATRTGKPSGTITLHQGQAGFIVKAGFGGGTLRYGGRSYRFSLGGLGIGGVGAAALEASGTVYNLKSVKDFPGPYAVVQTNAVAGDESTGEMWLRNAHDVYIKLRPKGQGLMVNAGADSVVISMQ
jgi:hypothetical protein